MQIVVDAHIPGVTEAFSHFGPVVALPGHEIGPADLRNAHCLIVRSVTRVDAGLLSGSPVAFVGSATAGTDHVDTSWLMQHDIRFAHAPGANADSVVEYVLAAMGEGLTHTGRALSDVTVGLVGYGEVGSRLGRRLGALGCTVLVCDPFRPEGTWALDDLVGAADVVSLHVPLTIEGPFPTQHMMDATRLGSMRPGAMLIQTSRGGVLDDVAAVRARRDGRLSWLVMDVWQDEPTPDPAVVATADVATPHIAGYSKDAKMAGVQMVARACADFLGKPPPPAARVDGRELPLPTSSTDLSALIRHMYPIMEDDARFRQTMTLDSGQRREAFHRLRAEYPVRYGFHRYRLDPDIKRRLTL